VLDRNELASASELERGAYVLWDAIAADDHSDGSRAEASGDGGPDVILISTGSEVSPTLQAARTLAAEGAKARVVSMPCMELFEAQPQAYREAVLPREVTARLAVEPGASMSWWKWVGSDGDVLALDRFGASAPGSRVLEELGFTAENIAARARTLLKSTLQSTP
jgi:transketolase